MSQHPPAQLVPHKAGGSGATSPSGSQALPPLATRVFEGLAAVRGPIVVLQGVTGVAYGEAAEVLLDDALRITVGTDGQTATVLDTLREILT